VSAINYSSIDHTFPIASQDNSTLGFRNNFTFIKDALQVAKTEITTLEKSHIYSIISASGGACTIDVTDGGYCRVTAEQATTFTFTNWPATYFELMLEVESDNISVGYVLSFPNTLNVGTLTAEYTMTVGKTSIFKIWYNGTITFVHRVGEFA
jgi:hypothetical protein